MSALPATMYGMNLAALHAIADERREHWAEAGALCEVVDGPLTDKPAAWLILSTDKFAAQLTVWVSGEAEMEWGTPERGDARHCDIDTLEDLRACVSDLEDALGLT
ncbi:MULTISPECIES: hypothetical protein [Kribbella]|nr:MULTISPECIES: hypothetical protein [Kribbella]